jgi:two-component system OmpR family sensor kinase/two-component system sensor histidine kinase QseC
MVRGDAQALHVLARNLADNAARYTPPGGIVRAVVEAEGDKVLFTVDDSGPGIAPAERERVFDRFYRCHPVDEDATGAAAQGSGLGLAIVRGIAVQHGAQITLHSSPLGGLRAVVLIPQAGAAGAATRPESGASS